MRKESEFKTFIDLYRKAKDSVLFYIFLLGMVVVVAFLLTWSIIIPQIQQYGADQEEIAKTRVKIKTIQENLDYVKRLNTDTLDSQLTIVFSALPSQKDYAGIMNALSLSGVNAGVIVGDYSLTIGKVASTSGISLINVATSSGEIAPLQLSLKVKGKLDDVKKFIKEMEEKLPIASVDGVDNSQGLGSQNISADEATLNFTFYSKDFPAITYSDDQPIKKLTSKDEATLARISGYKQDYGLLEALSATGSGTTVTEDPF